MAKIDKVGGELMPDTMDAEKQDKDYGAYLNDAINEGLSSKASNFSRTALLEKMRAAVGVDAIEENGAKLVGL